MIDRRLTQVQGLGESYLCESVFLEYRDGFEKTQVHILLEIAYTVFIRFKRHKFTFYYAKLQINTVTYKFPEKTILFLSGGMRCLLAFAG